jgi:hypothetical protein
MCVYVDPDQLSGNQKPLTAFVFLSKNQVCSFPSSCTLTTAVMLMGAFFDFFDPAGWCQAGSRDAFARSMPGSVRDQAFGAQR